MKTFLYSFPPKINKDKNVKQIIDIFKELKALGQTAQIDSNIPHFIIHQLLFFDPLYRAEFEDFDVKLTNDYILQSLLQPFTDKHLKNDYIYII